MLCTNSYPMLSLELKLFFRSHKAIAFCLFMAGAVLQADAEAAAIGDPASNTGASREVTPTFPEAGRFSQDRGNIIIAAETSIPSAVASAQISAGRKISTGVSGLAKYGFNIHQWPMAMVGPMFKQVGAKVIRINVTYRQYIQAGAYPGKSNGNAVAQATIDATAGAGLDVLLSISNPVYPATDPSMAQWPAFIEAVATANSKNSNVIFELGNEPNTGKVTAQQYFDLMKISYPALKKGNPAAKLAVPVINVSYTPSAKKFVAELMAMPGVFDLFDLGDFHPYYNTPEKSYFVDLDAFIRSVDAPATKAGKSIEFVASEVGWSDATGALAALGSAPRKTGDTHLQTAEGAADYYSRYIPIARDAQTARRDLL